MIQKIYHTVANTPSMIALRLSSDTLQQKDGIVTVNSCVREETRIEPRDKISRAIAGKAADRHDLLHVYAAGVQFSVFVAPYNLT